MGVWNRNNLALLEGLLQYPNFRVFVADGEGHCGMTFDRALQAAGFKEWIESLLAGGSPSNVTCGANCTLAGLPGCDGVVGSGALEDRCGVCEGNGLSCPLVPVADPDLRCLYSAVATVEPDTDSVRFSRSTWAVVFVLFSWCSLQV